MHFRLFRSRAFWFGVPGLLFLLWGWWLSTGHYSWAGFGGASPWGIGQLGGEVFAVWDAGGGPEWGNFNAGHDEMTGEDVRRVKDMWSGIGERDPSVRYVFIPYYWPVIGYVAGWAGLIAWRARSYRQASMAAAVE